MDNFVLGFQFGVGACLGFAVASILIVVFVIMLSTVFEIARDKRGYTINFGKEPRL